MKSRRLMWAAAGAAVLVTFPLGITATTAAWTESEWVHGEVGTQTIDCGTTTGFAEQSSGRFLSGALLGQNLDPIVALAPMSLSQNAAGTPTVSPPTANNLGSTPPTYTYANPLNISALGGIVGLDLTGFQVGLPVGSAGAVNQWAKTTAYGTAAGASGLVSNSGGVLVSSTTPADQLPEPATITLDTLLPAVTGIASTKLQVGAVGASSQLDGCAALKSALWGDGSVTGVTRDYGIAGLGLHLSSPAVSGLVGTVNTGVANITTAVDSLLGSNGLISNAIAARLRLALPNVLTTTVNGNVTISGLNLSTAVSSLLTTTLTDGVVTVNLQTGAVDVDLNQLLPSLNDAPPNTEVVINSAVLAPIITRVGTLLNNWTSQITAALTQALRNATLNVNLSAVVAAPGFGILPPLDVLNVAIGVNATIGAILDGTATVSVSANAAGLVGPINTLLAALGLPTVTQLITTVNALGPALLTTIANQITTTAIGAITTLGTTLSTSVNAIVNAVGTLVNALPNVLSLMVNVQPDQSGAPPGSTYIPGTSTSTPQYIVSALRIGLANFLTPSGIAHVTFGTASAGPVTAP